MSNTPATEPPQGRAANIPLITRRIDGTAVAKRIRRSTRSDRRTDSASELGRSATATTVNVVSQLDGLTHATGVDRMWGSCCASAVHNCQATVEDSGSGDGNSVSSFWRPPHPSALSHPGVGNVIDRTFCAR